MCNYLTIPNSLIFQYLINYIKLKSLLYSSVYCLTKIDIKGQYPYIAVTHEDATYEQLEQHNDGLLRLTFKGISKSK